MVDDLDRCEWVIVFSGTSSPGYSQTKGHEWLLLLLFYKLMLSCCFCKMYFFGIYRCDFDAEQFAESSIPILVVGTKIDQVTSMSDELSQRSFSIAEECGADEVNLVIESCTMYTCISFLLLIFSLDLSLSMCTGHRATCDPGIKYTIYVEYAYAIFKLGIAKMIYDSIE